MRDYELVLIVSAELAEEDVNGAVEKVAKYVADKGGAMGDINHWGKRKLAYPIKRRREGNYVLTKFKLEQGKTAELESNLRMSEAVLRHLLIKVGE